MLETQYYKIPGSNGYKINCKYNIIDYEGNVLKYTRFPGFCLSNSIDLDVAYSFIQEDGTGIVPDSKLRFRLVYE